MRDEKGQDYEKVVPVMSEKVSKNEIVQKPIVRNINREFHILPGSSKDKLMTNSNCF